MRYFAFVFILSLQNPACILNIILQPSHISSAQQSQVAPLGPDSTVLGLASSLRGKTIHRKERLKLSPGDGDPSHLTYKTQT